MKTMIEVDDDALEKLDEFLHWCYTENLGDKREEWGDGSHLWSIPETLIGFAKPIAKSFGLYPYNQPKVSMNMDS